MRGNIIPTMRYRDAAAAIDWLCRAFGFERHLVVPGEQGTITHAQLTLGNGMIMLGSARDDEFGKLQKTPAQVGGVGTQSPYIIVPDADAHHEEIGVERSSAAQRHGAIVHARHGLAEMEHHPLRFVQRLNE